MIDAQHNNININHGASGYRNYGCKCQKCSEAASAQSRHYREIRLKKTRDNGGVAPIEAHGRSTYTNWGCKCDICRVANTTASKEYKRKTGRISGSRRHDLVSHR